MAYLRVEREEEIVQITINRQDKLNAMNLDVMNEFISLLDNLEKDSSKVIIITGDGPKAFSAGADIEYMSSIGPTEAEKYALRGHEVLNRIEKLEKPVIAAINGYALGGGCELALACDIRFASPNAQLGQPEVTLGICPGWGGTQRLLRIVGPSRAKDLIFSGRKITAEEAFSMGLVNKIIPCPPFTHLPTALGTKLLPREFSVATRRYLCIGKFVWKMLVRRVFQ